VPAGSEGAVEAGSSKRTHGSAGGAHKGHDAALADPVSAEAAPASSAPAAPVEPGDGRGVAGGSAAEADGAAKADALSLGKARHDSGAAGRKVVRALGEDPNYVALPQVLVPPSSWAGGEQPLPPEYADAALADLETWLGSGAQTSPISPI